ncbi:MAG: DUF2339 domain-containing protein, partial [Verrucomicrobia bacterium]|nr:DUF2339 domain-containing protein [Verrucomicrobiota bacterium]
MVQSIILIFALALLVFPLWAILRILALGQRNEALERRLSELAGELRELRDKTRGPSAPPAFVPPSAAPAPATAPAATPPAATPVSDPPSESPLLVQPPPLAPVVAEAAPPPIAPPLATPPGIAPPAAPAPPLLLPPVLPPAPAQPAPRVNWEQFMGAKLSAWLGGFAAILGAAFFVKYSFEHDLIPPEVRAALGFLFGIALVIGGLKIPRDRYAVTAQTLCATGIASLYAVTFACNSTYHFAFFDPLATFLLMTLVTAAAFGLAVRLDAQVVAILGLLGGFITPVLLSTGRDNPGVLFGYIALLDLGLVAVALRQRWQFLVPLGATGTVLMQIAWVSRFLDATKAPTAMVICLGFCALFLGGYFVARRLARNSPHVARSAVAFPFVALAFAAVFIGYSSVAARPGLLFGFVLLADTGLLALAWCEQKLAKLHLIAGVAVFALLAAWTGTRLTTELLPWALAFCLVHAVLHTAFPLRLERDRPAGAPMWWSQLFPPLALFPFLLLIMMTLRLPLENPSPVFGLALLLVALALGLTFVLTRPFERHRTFDSGEPMEGGCPHPPFGRLRGEGTAPTSNSPTTRISAGVAWLPICALAGVVALEYAWHARQFTAENALGPLAWYLVFHTAFAVYPFVFRRRFATLTGPWAVAALSGV